MSERGCSPAAGAIAEASRLSAEAVALAAQTDWVVDHADTLIARAEVLRATGDASAADAVAREALTLYERKGDVVSARRTRALLNGAG